MFFVCVCVHAHKHFKLLCGKCYVSVCNCIVSEQLWNFKFTVLWQNFVFVLRNAIFVLMIFICHLFNNIFNVSNYIVFNHRQKFNWKWFRRKQSHSDMVYCPNICLEELTIPMKTLRTAVYGLRVFPWLIERMWISALSSLSVGKFCLWIKTVDLKLYMNSGIFVSERNWLAEIEKTA
jgi:hypothetical protein